MTVKKIGISRDLIIHPGETIADVLEERGITQADLAVRTGVTPAYVCSVIAGKKDISAKFALALEYALSVPKSFWLNLQANYDAELLELYEYQSITEEERLVRESLKDIVKYLRDSGKLADGENKDDSIISLRRVLQISNLVNLKGIVPAGAFRMDHSVVNPYVMGAWICMCQLSSGAESINAVFDISKIDSLIYELKAIMLDSDTDLQNKLVDLMASYGIDFSIVKSFRGAPVYGYISKKNNGIYQMVLTIRGSSADIFWFTLFHELGHIVNGDVGKAAKFIDDGRDQKKEEAADLFSSNKLMDERAYTAFVSNEKYGIDMIKEFASSQHVMPCIVIGRLQKEKILHSDSYSEYMLRYKWIDD